MGKGAGSASHWMGPIGLMGLMGLMSRSCKSHWSHKCHPHHVSSLAIGYWLLVIRVAPAGRFCYHSRIDGS